MGGGGASVALAVAGQGAPRVYLRVWQPQLRESVVRDHFEQFGEVRDVYKPEGKPFGFVTFASQAAVQAAVLTPVHLIEGFPVPVMVAAPRREVQGGSGGGGGGGGGGGNNGGIIGSG